MMRQIDPLPDLVIPCYLSLLGRRIAGIHHLKAL